MMLFLNMMLLGGAAAAVIPLIIHLLNRTRFKLLDWGAMHLLESALKINSRRVQWQAWLLLLLRMLIPALLALCLARPVLTAWRTAAGGNQHSVVLIVDNSLSMEASCERRLDGAGASSSSSDAANSCFDTAVAEAAALIERFGPSTELTILTSGGGVVDQTAGATFDRQRALRRLREIRVGAGASAMDEALSQAFSYLSKSKQPRRHLILLSDFQRSEWEGLAPESLATLRAASNSQGPTVEVTFIPVKPSAPENLSVHIDRPAGASVVAHHQALEVRVSVRNHGRTQAKNLPVVLSVDGESVTSKNVEVAGDSQVFLVFTCELQTLGSHLLSVAIDEAALRRSAGETPAAIVTTDDVARWSIEVIEPVRVGIVSMRDPDSKTIDDATFLNLALSPYAVSLVAGAISEETAGWAEAHAGADPIRCEIIAPEDLNERRLASVKALALTNVPVFDAATVERIAKFVEAGGLLMIWAGDALQPNWYNQHWGPSSPHTLLPYEYGQISRPADRSVSALKIHAQSYDHPGLTLFNRSSNGRLDSIDFHSWFKLVKSRRSPTAAEAPAHEPASSASEPGSEFTLLALENGDPLLAERAVGRGRVLQWATSCDDRWSNLPLREVFVPLMQQLVLYGATASSPRLNLETGQTLAVAWHEPIDGSEAKPTANSTQRKADAASARAEETKELVELLTPHGARYRLEPQSTTEQLSVQFVRTQFPGAYQLSGAGRAVTTVAVGTCAEESVLAPLTSSSLNGYAERLEAQVKSSADEFWQGEMVKQTGREVWRWMLLALVASLFAELLLQQSLTRTPA